MEAVGPWVQDCLRLMGAEGIYAHYKHPGELTDQPALDMDILDIVKSKWCELRNKEMERRYGQKS